MLNWLNAKTAETQADQAIADVQRLVPKGELDSAEGARKKQIAKLDQTINQHRTQAAAARYNIYQKAKFANRIKWGLREGGYPDDFVDSVVRLLII